jgi:hypothetical protein
VIESKEAMLQSKDAVLESKDALLQSKDAAIAKLQEPTAQRPDTPASSSSADTTVLAQRLAAAEACLRQLEAASSANGGESSSLELPNHKQKRACRAPAHMQPLEKDEVLDEIFTYVGRKEWLYVADGGEADT